MAALSITDAIFSRPSPRKMPSALVGIERQVPRIWLPFMPFSYGVNFLGSQVSVWATPPGSQMKIMASAVALGAAARIADDAVAAAAVRRKSRLVILCTETRGS